MTTAPRHLQLADVLETMADVVGSRLAVVAGDDRRTYRELDDRATRLANHLRTSGVGPGDHVAIHAPNRVEWIEAFYACFKLRAVPVNINYRYREQELRYLFDNSDCVAVLAAPEQAASLDAVDDALPLLRSVLVMGDEYESAVAAAADDRSFPERSGDDIYMLYTGGTTGLPKGVMWRNEDLILGALNSARQGAPLASIKQLAGEVHNADPSTVMALGPMMHGGCQWSMGNVHLVGGTFVLYCEASFDPESALRVAEQEAITSLSLIGDAMAKPIADLLLDDDAPELDLSSLMVIANGAAPLSGGVRSRLSRAIPHAFIIDSYGASETGSTGTGLRTNEDEGARFNVGEDTAVFTADLSRRATPGESGLLGRRGHIPLGYYKDPDKTARTFPTIEGTRWAVPGDFAMLDEAGTIVLLGRGSGTINTGGEKVFPEEVEAALSKLDGVADAVVVGTPHERWGEQVTALVARTRDTVDEAHIRDHCRHVLADYKVPKSVLFIDTVPRTPVGKLDYKAARGLADELLGGETAP